MFDYVVIDSPPAFTEHVLTAFDLSDTFVLLATLDIPALKNLRLTLDMLDLLGYPRESWQVVLNRSDSKVGLEVADVERSLRTPIAALIPSSRAVSASINKGVPILLDEPNHPVSVAIRRFADERVRTVREVVPVAVPAAGPAAPVVDPYERHANARPRRQRTRQLAFLRRSES